MYCFSSPFGALLLGNALGVLGGVSGKALFFSSTKAEMEPDPQNSDYGKEITKLHEWSVFSDSLIYTSDIEMIPLHSRAMRRLYPQKHFRITLGLNWGINSLENDMRDAISSSGLPPWQEYNQTALGFQFLDFSWRFKQHWILGGGFMTNYDDMVNAYYYPYYESMSDLLEYNYSVDLTDFRVYMDYAIKPVNRFLTHRSEFLVGGGVILSKPSTNLWFYYVTNPETGDYEYTGSRGSLG